MARMADYKPNWDLTTVPTPEWNAENGRRARLKAPRITNVNYQPCEECGTPLTAKQRRKPCPKCEHVHPRTTKAK